MTSILLVEDHPLLVRSIEKLLAARSEVSRFEAVGSAEEALVRLPSLRVDLALVDISLPGMSGLDLIARMAESRPEVPCLALSGHREATYVRRALEAGARGYVNKEQATSLPEAIRRVMAGEMYLSDDLMALPELASLVRRGPAGG
jgi:DNA-binding NarL/FixJ family response regulator